MLHSVGTPGMWAGFLAFVLVMLALDLGVFHRKAHEVSVKEAATWTAVWIALSGVFCLGVWKFLGAQVALEFATGYLLEKALSVDNIFVFVVVFSFFGVPKALQHRVLFWGILGALLMRAGFIFAGSAFVARFHWAIYVFGALLLLTGLKLLLRKDGEEVHPEKNPLVRLVKRFIPVTSEFRGAHFLVRENGRRFATPLLIALVTIEATDLLFAVDSIPAVFAVTLDPFIVFTSNIFAILGLRALYFLLAGVMDRFKYLQTGLALVLVFVGGKMIATDYFKVPIGASLATIALLIGGSIAFSLWRTAAEARAQASLQPVPVPVQVPPEDQ